MVEVDVRVLGKDGRFVTGLGAPDFEISEDGVPQKIQSVVLIGAPAAPLAPSAPSAHSTPAPLAPSAPLSHGSPPTWVFIFDTAHLTGGSLQRARTAAAGFFEGRFPEGDLGGVVADGTISNNRFTSVRSEELAKAARDIKIPGDTRSPAAPPARMAAPPGRGRGVALRPARHGHHHHGRRYAGLHRRSGLCNRPNGRASVEALLGNKARETVVNVHDARESALVTIDALAKGLARMPGPKTVVFFSEGFILQDSRESFAWPWHKRRARARLLFG